MRHDGGASSTGTGDASALLRAAPEGAAGAHSLLMPSQGGGEVLSTGARAAHAKPGNYTRAPRLPTEGQERKFW